MLLSLLAASAIDLQSALITSPTVPVEGIVTRGPFLLYQAEAPSVRYQELRAASDFTALGSPMLITEFSMWAPQGGLPIDVTLPNVTIHFSTTPQAPNQISTTFAQNIGPDETTVFSGPLHLVDPRYEPYGLHVPLQTPFYYDPSQGNLLMDVWNYQTIPTPTGGGYSVLLGTRATTVTRTIAHDVSASTGITPIPNGMFIQFTVTPVPEPSTCALLAVGLGVLVLHRPARNAFRRKEPRS